MIKKFKYFRKVAPKTGWKYVIRVVKHSIIWLAVLLVIGFLSLQIHFDEYGKVLGLILVSSLLSGSAALKELDAQISDERREMLRSVFVEGVVNSTFVYRDAETIDQVFENIRDVVRKNTRVDFYNEFSLWDFEELLAECLNDLRKEVDSNISAEWDVSR